MRYFFRQYDEDGQTDHYFEFDGRYVVREIVVHPSLTMLLGRTECSEMSLESYQFSSAEEITADEFAAMWQSWLQRPHSTRGDDHPLIQKALRRLESP